MDIEDDEELKRLEILEAKLTAEALKLEAERDTLKVGGGIKAYTKVHM